MKYYKKNNCMIYVTSTFNNTIATLSDKTGKVLSWVSGGSIGYKGVKKSTSLALQIISEKIAQKASNHNFKLVDVYIKGVGVNKEIILRIINNCGLKIRSLNDITPIPHNGCRKKKKRRV